MDFRTSALRAMSLVLAVGCSASSSTRATGAAVVGDDAGVSTDEFMNGVLIGAAVPFSSGNALTREALVVLTMSPDGSTVTSGAAVGAAGYDGTSSTTYGAIASSDLARVQAVLVANGAVTTTMSTPGAATTITLSAQWSCSGSNDASACLTTATPGDGPVPTASGNDDAGDAAGYDAGDAGGDDTGPPSVSDDELINDLLSAAGVPSTPTSALILLATNDDASLVLGGAVVALVGNGAANPPDPVSSSTTYGTIATSELARVQSILTSNGATTTTTSTPDGASATTLSIAASCTGAGSAASCLYGVDVAP